MSFLSRVGTYLCSFSPVTHRVGTYTEPSEVASAIGGSRATFFLRDHFVRPTSPFPTTARTRPFLLFRYYRI